jgi:hypothetical protein
VAAEARSRPTREEVLARAAETPNTEVPIDITSTPEPGAAARAQVIVIEEPHVHPEHRFLVTTRCKACGKETTAGYEARFHVPGQCSCGGALVVERDIDTHA